MLVINKLKELQSLGIYVRKEEWGEINPYGIHQVTLGFYLEDPESINSKIPGQCEWCKKDDEPTRQGIYDDMVFHHRCWQKYKLKHKGGPTDG